MNSGKTAQTIFICSCVILLCSIATLVILTTNDDPNVLNKFEARILAQHNVLREAHGLSILTWDPDLAQANTEYAQTCPGLRHGGPKGNQNIASFSWPCAIQETVCPSGTSATWLLYAAEEQLWNYDTNACRTGNWADCGHFNNMMAPEASKIGCGFSTACDKTPSNAGLFYCSYVHQSSKERIPPPNNAEVDLKSQLDQYTIDT